MSAFVHRYVTARVIASSTACMTLQYPMCVCVFECDNNNTRVYTQMKASYKKKNEQNEEEEKWQERIAELIVKNERLEVELTNTTFDANDAIAYLKRAVEERDGQVSGW